MLLVQLSKRPVRESPTFTALPSKHWSQLFAPKSALDEHDTEVYSPREDPREGVTVVVTGAALIVVTWVAWVVVLVVVVDGIPVMVLTVVVGVVTVVVVGSISSFAAKTAGTIEAAATIERRIFRIEKVGWGNKTSKALYNLTNLCQKKPCGKGEIEYTICTFIL